MVAAPIVGYAISESALFAAVAVVALVLGISLVGRPWWLVPPMLVGTWFSNFSVNAGFGLVSMADLVALALIPLWTFHRLSNRRRPRVVPELWALIAFLVLSFVSLVNGVNPGSAYNAFVRFLEAVFVYLVLVDLCDSPAKLRTACWLLFVCGLVHAVVGLGLYEGVGRLGGLFDQPNSLGHALAIPFLIGLGLIGLPNSRWVRTVIMFGLTLIALAIVLTISRGTYLALGVALLWWLRRSRQAVALLLVTGLFVTWGLPYVLQNAQTQIAGRLEMHDNSVDNRWTTLLNGFSAIDAHPFLGVGFGQFQELDKAVEVTQQAGRSAHNFYVSVAASSGVPALALLLAFAVPPARRLWHWQRDTRGSTDAGLLETGRIVTAFQGVSLYMATALLTKGGDLMIFWVVLGLMGAASLMPRQRST